METAQTLHKTTVSGELQLPEVLSSVRGFQEVNHDASTVHFLLRLLDNEGD